VLKAANASGETAFGKNTGLNHIKIGDLEIPTDADGAVFLKFRPSNPAAYFPAWKVLSGEVPREQVEGRIILVGTSAPGLLDLRATPLDAAVTGVEIHAQLLEHILAGRSLTRPDYALALEEAVIVGLGILLALILPRAWSRFSDDKDANSRRARALAGMAPLRRLASRPWRNTIMVGMLRIAKRALSSGCASVSTLAMMAAPAREAASFSSSGATARQGPHQAAQKSTRTGALAF